MVIFKEATQIKENLSYQDWETLKSGNYRTAFYTSKDGRVKVTITNPKVAGTKQMNIYNGNDKLSIDFDKVQRMEVQKTVWAIYMVDGGGLYLTA